MRPRFVLQEIANGLRRNVTMGIAVVVTVMVSLALLGGSMLVTNIVDRMHAQYFGKLEVAVYLQSTATQAEKTTLQGQLTGDPLVKAVQYVTHEQAYQAFKRQNADDPDLVNSVSSPDALPDSFQVQLKDPERFEVLRSEYLDSPGVDTISDQQRVLEPLFELLDGLKTVARAVAILAGVAALLTTFNTIRLAAFSRRREIGIMRLVGAGNFTIQLPFVLEGVIAGVVGAAAASGLLAAAKAFLLDRTLEDFFHANVVPNVPWHEVLGVMPLLAVLGIAVAAAASYVTSLFYVRV